MRNAAKTKCMHDGISDLQFLELRNLTERVSDISVYLAIKNIPKLEKIAFHGEHRVSFLNIELKL